MIHPNEKGRHFFGLFKVGDEVKPKWSDYRGTIVEVKQGCPKPYTVEHRDKKHGKVIRYYSEDQLELHVMDDRVLL